MRITNNMIMNNTKANINSNKLNVDKYNTQMTTQKKISKASEDPVIAIRSLRLSTTLTHVDQYADNNIPDADSWLDVTYTALNNMKDLVTDIRTQCVNGSTDTLTASDRETIQKNLEALQDQIYSEGNADYAGRTVFTGYRTNSNLTFDSDEDSTQYVITEQFDYEDMELHRYYSGDAEVPTVISTDTDPVTGEYTTIADSDEIGKETYYRLRMAYSDIDEPIDGSDTLELSVSYLTTDGSGNSVSNAETQNVKIYASEEEWMADTANYPLTADSTDQAVFICSTGEMVFSDSLATTLRNEKAEMFLEYTKTGFDEGDLRPEYYFTCTKNTLGDPATSTTTDPATGDPVTSYNVIDYVDYDLEDQPIDYTIANCTTLTINTQARDVFDQNIGRDVEELINCVSYATEAEKKVDKIKDMMAQEKYADDDSQAVLQTYLDAAQKEADYANDNLQKTYESYIGNFDEYLTKINTAITNVGSMQSRLSLTKNRVENQQETVEELKTNNEDRDLSDIIIDYYAANNAYQASLTAASKVDKQNLLNYL